MTGPAAAAAFAGNPVFSCGRCPGCAGGGALLLLRRRHDAALLYHCPGCGLSFTHVPEGEEPEAGRALDEIAPAGADPATGEEVRAAGLEKYAEPWTGGTHRSSAPREEKPKKPRRRRSRVLRSTGAAKEKKTVIWPIMVAVFLIIKILMNILRD